MTVLAEEQGRVGLGRRCRDGERHGGRGGRRRRRPRHRPQHRARRASRARGRRRHPRRRATDGPAAAPTSSPPATSPGSRFPRSAARGGSSTRIMRTRTAAWSARTWPAPRSSTTTSPSSTRTSSTSATRPSATWTRDSRRVEHWVEPGRKGVVVYVDDDGRAKGALLWDVWGKVDDARGLILAGTRVSPEIAPRLPRLKRRRDARESGDERQGEDVEDDVPARGAARRVALRDPETRDDAVPRPRPDRRAVDLEQRDDHEDARVHGPARRQQHDDEKRAADGARDVGRRAAPSAPAAPRATRRRSRPTTGSAGRRAAIVASDIPPRYMSPWPGGTNVGRFSSL